MRVSLRSLGEVDVRRVAEAHGGGGHRFAAGFTLDARRPDGGRAHPGRALSRCPSRRSRARRADRRAGRRRQARGLDVARRRREAPRHLRTAARRPRGHPRSRRDRRAARRPRPVHAAPAVPPGDAARSTGATVRFGVATSTLDAAGEVLDRRPMPITREQVERATAAFVGDIDQVPPMVSAIKIGGRRLHELAREGEEVERAAAAGPHRPHRRRGVRARRVPDRRRCASSAAVGHLHPLARRRPRRGPRRLRAPRLAAAAARRVVRRRRGTRRSTTIAARPGSARCRRPARGDARPRAARRRRRAGAAPSPTG